ncbi:MAG: polysaccharide biosynthesis tyrosine autokinase [Acutalibacteraceae bacterium]|nr:polysaccharide biosynthesis tyrosine autokinase [Acutalibacteraceae bacterium]
MSEKESLENYSSYNYSFDLYSTVKDVLRRWHLILFVAVLGAMGCFVYSTETYTPQYTTSVTMLVQSKTAEKNPTATLATTNKLAVILKAVLDSEQLHIAVAKQLGENTFPGYLSREVIEETNIIVIRVVSDSPVNSYRLLNAVLDNYPTFTRALSSNVLLQTLDPPIIPAWPSNGSNSGFMMTLGFMGGAIVTIGFLAVMSYFKDTIKKEDDIKKKLNIKKIASVPRQNKKLTLKEKMQGVKKSLSLSNPVIGFEFKESFKKLRRLITAEKKKNGDKLFAVTSSLENEGKTTISVNLAISLARLKCKVLLVEGDLRKPAVTKFLDKQVEEGKSIIDYLNGEARLSDVTMYDDVLNLHIIGCNKGTGKANELVLSEKMKYLLATAKENYDYIVIDTPPLGFASDAEDLMAEADASLLVVRRDVATAIAINDTIEIINNTGAKLLGCVYNDSEVTSLTASTYGYGGYGYGYGYGYGGYGYGGYGRYGGYGGYGAYGKYKSIDSNEGSNKKGGVADEQ